MSRLDRRRARSIERARNHQAQSPADVLAEAEPIHARAFCHLAETQRAIALDQAAGIDTSDVEARLVLAIEQLHELDDEMGMLREMVRILDRSPRMTAPPHVAAHLDEIGLHA